MKYVPHIAAALLGLLFIVSSVPFLLHMMPMPEMPKDQPPGMFMGAMVPTGYLAFVKVVELIGGILVVIPRTRNLGLLALGPVIVNILAFSVLIMKGEGLASPMTAIIVVIPLYLMWCERRAFAGLVNRPAAA